MIGELHGMEGDEVGVQSVWTASTKCLGLSQVGFEEVPKELRLDIIWYCVAISLVQNIVVRSQGALMYRPPTAFPILSLLYQNSSVCIPGGHSCDIVEHEVGAMSSLLLLFHPIRLGIFSILSPSLLSLLSLSIHLSTCLLFNVSALQRFCSSTFLLFNVSALQRFLARQLCSLVSFNIDREVSDLYFVSLQLGLLYACGDLQEHSRAVGAALVRPDTLYVQDFGVGWRQDYYIDRSARSRILGRSRVAYESQRPPYWTLYSSSPFQWSSTKCTFAKVVH
jgi:hypothetical protein